MNVNRMQPVFVKSAVMEFGQLCVRNQFWSTSGAKHVLSSQARGIQKLTELNTTQLVLN